MGSSQSRADLHIPTEADPLKVVESSSFDPLGTYHLKNNGKEPLKAIGTDTPEAIEVNSTRESRKRECESVNDYTEEATWISAKFIAASKILEKSESKIKSNAKCRKNSREYLLASRDDIEAESHRGRCELLLAECSLIGEGKRSVDNRRGAVCEMNSTDRELIYECLQSHKQLALINSYFQLWRTNAVGL